MTKTNVATEYYIVFLPINEDKMAWNELKLLFKIAEADYLVFRCENTNRIEVYQVSKEEYNSYYYNPN